MWLREGNVLPSQIVEMTPPSARRSWTLTLTVLLLLFLPLVLPTPCYNLAQQWIFPMVRTQLDRCDHNPICSIATDEARWAWLLVLGPSMLVAGASVLLGTQKW
jgi:hypothetical protein